MVRNCLLLRATNLPGRMNIILQFVIATTFGRPLIPLYIKDGLYIDDPARQAELWINSFYLIKRMFDKNLRKGRAIPFFFHTTGS